MVWMCGKSVRTGDESGLAGSLSRHGDIKQAQGRFGKAVLLFEHGHGFLFLEDRTELDEGQGNS